MYYTCDSSSLACLVTVNNAKFISNYAAIKGGAIHWDTLEPFFFGQNPIQNSSAAFYKGNVAGLYGNQISCFAR